MIPAKLDLYSALDAAGVLRGLIFAGVTRIDAVALDVSTAIDDEGYVDGVVRLLQQIQMLLTDETKFFILGSGSKRLEGLTTQVADSLTLGIGSDKAIPVVIVDHGWVYYFFFKCFLIALKIVLTSQERYLSRQGKRGQGYSSIGECISTKYSLCLLCIQC